MLFWNFKFTEINFLKFRVPFCNEKTLKKKCKFFSMTLQVFQKKQKKKNIKIKIKIKNKKIKIIKKKE
jgi:hypothetical protein